jgi:hypothetical protein
MYKLIALAGVVALTTWTSLAATASAKPFPGFTWKSLQDGQGLTSGYYTTFGETGDRVLRPPFEQALAGNPRAVEAFFDLALIVDGEHAFTHGRMTLLVINAIGDRAFQRILSSRSAWVQWAITRGLSGYLQGYGPVVRARFPLTLALAHHWEAFSATKMRQTNRSEGPIWLRR